MTDHDLLITSGVGPSEARRFVFQLAARIERLAAQHGLDVLDVLLHGDPTDDAPRSITLRLRGEVLGELAGELGTHVLVHRSRARGRSARKRWFVAVTLHAAVPDRGPAIAIARDELEITACRAGGPGGQHVNKVSSAVRVRHVPSGLVVRSAGARSQRTNLDHALRRLAGLLAARAEARLATDAAARRATHYRVERGRPVRTYRLDPDGHLVESTSS